MATKDGQEVKAHHPETASTSTPQLTRILRGMVFEGDFVTVVHYQTQPDQGHREGILNALYLPSATVTTGFDGVGLALPSA